MHIIQELVVDGYYILELKYKEEKFITIRILPEENKYHYIADEDHSTSRTVVINRAKIWNYSKCQKFPKATHLIVSDLHRDIFEFLKQNFFFPLSKSKPQSRFTSIAKELQ